MTIAAIVVRDAACVRFAGLDLDVRAQRVARRAGIDQVQIVDDARPFAAAPFVDLLLVLPASVIAEPAAIRALLARGLEHREDACVVADADGSNTDVMMLSAVARERIRAVPRLRSALRRLSVEVVVAVAQLAPRFVVRMRDGFDVPTLETEYLRHTNGGDGEGWFTKNIRWFSVPLSRGLARNGTSANEITCAGFGLAIASGAAFGIGTYWAGIVGALCYWASMVLDCCDGEVARATISDSKFGAWLETATDYLSYFMVLAGIVWGDVHHEGMDYHAVAAALAAACSAAIVALVGYQRARVASSNPGAFDDALAATLARGDATQRFAVWGRQLIKRAFFAHLLVFQAVIGFVPALTEIWAYGASAALLVVLAVQTHILRKVRVQPLGPAAALPSR
jgi:phosphatidylglycerophosphate synthase